MLYGTVAQFTLLPGKQNDLLAVIGQAPGEVFEYIYQLDTGSDEYLMVVGFESKAAYQANAERPEMQDRYAAFLALLTADPVWRDGTIVYARQS